MGLVKVNANGTEEIITGDDAPLDITRVRLVVSSGPVDTGADGPTTVVKHATTPSWSVKDAATKKPSADGLTATAYDERLTTGAYAAMDLMKGSKQANRFSNWSNGSNDGHGHAGHSSCWGSTLDETSGDLAIGYKSQGSFLVDFRQVDTTPQENLGNITYNPSGYIGYDNNARAGISSVAPEGTWFMEQGSSNFYNVRCPYYLSLIHI